MPVFKFFVSKPAIKYLGAMIHAMLSYEKHMQYACEKPSSSSVALAKMIPNVGGGGTVAYS